MKYTKVKLMVFVLYFTCSNNQSNRNRMYPHPFSFRGGEVPILTDEAGLQVLEFIHRFLAPPFV